MKVKTSVFALSLLIAAGACTPAEEAADENVGAAEEQAATEEGAEAQEQAAANEEAADEAAADEAEEAPAAAASVSLPEADAVPEGAPSLPGFEFPNYGTLRAGAHAYFPTSATAERLMAGEVEAAGNSWFRGTVDSVNEETMIATVTDAQGNTYDVPVAYVIQGAEPVETVEVGQVYVGNRFNRGELVMATTAEPDEYGEVMTVRLAGSSPDDPREDEVAQLVQTATARPGSNAICHGPNGTRVYQVIRYAEGKVLGFDSVFVRVLDASLCAFPELQPSFEVGDEVVAGMGLRVREGTVREINAERGVVTVGYPWGADERTVTSYFGSVVTEMPEEPAED